MTAPNILDFADPQAEYERLWRALEKIAESGGDSPDYYSCSFDGHVDCVELANSVLQGGHVP